MGGTGKTPLLIRLANDLKSAGRHPAILSRGYGEDELTLMKEKCAGVPLGAGANRFASSVELLKTNPVDVFLLDDGFQHWALRRDMDIVCIDAAARFETEFLLPIGRLREPWSSLGRANVAVITRAHLATGQRRIELKRRVQELIPGGTVLVSEFERTLVESRTGNILPWEEIRGKKVVAVSAIGNPAAFEGDLIQQGAIVVPLRFRDHRVYGERDVARIKGASERNAAPLVTTEKDWVKLKQFGLDMRIVRVDVRFAEDDESRWKSLVRGMVR